MKKPSVFAAICIVCVLVAAAPLAVACLPMPDIPPFDPERGVDGVRIAFYNTHLDYTGTQVDGRLLRELQVEFIFELMQSDPSPYKVLTGDFNISSFDDLAPFFDSDEYALFINPDNALATFAGGSPFACIDNIVYTCKTLRLTNGRVVENDLSDHYMLTASFETLA